MELLVVVAVMAVAMSGVIYGVYLLRSGDAKKAVQTLSGQLSTHRSNTLAKSGEWQFELVNDNGRYVLAAYQNGTQKEQQRLGSRIRIYYTSETSGANEKELAKQERLVITFLPGSGKVSDVRLVSGGEISEPAASDAGNSVQGSGAFLLRVSGGEEGGESLRLYYETGKVIVN